MDEVNRVNRANGFYIQGARFAQCAERCMGDKNDDGSIQIIGGKNSILSSPLLVNSAFACEMYMKSLLILNNIPYQKSHGLKSLFDLLPKQYQDFLRIEKYSRKEFDKELDEHSDDFVKWRYYVENPGEYSMSPMFTFLMMLNLGEIVKTEIDSAGGDN